MDRATPRFFFLLIWFGYLAYNRFIAADEGFYAIAAKLVLAGKLPYLDFFYPQAPLLPFVHAALFELLGVKWVVLRGLAAVVGSVIGYLVFAIVYKRWGSQLAWLAVFLYSTSTLVVGWFSTAKPYGLSGLLLLLGYVAFVESRPAGFTLSRDRSRWVFAGIALGLATNIRLYLVVAAAVPVLALLLETRSLHNMRPWAALFGLGFAVTFIPQLYFAVIDFDRFWFNNVGYHLNRSELAFEEGLRQKLEVALVTLGVRKSEFYSNFQVLLLLALGCFAFFWRQRGSIDPAALMWLALAIINLIPTPTWVQYFSLTVPFLLIYAVPGLRFATAPLGNYASLRVGVLFSLLALFVSQLELKRYTVTGENLQFVRRRFTDAATIEGLEKVSASINAVTERGEVVLSRWPGYLLESQATSLVGYENQFWVRVQNALSREERERYMVGSKADLSALVSAGKVRVVITDRPQRFFPDDLLAKSGYDCSLKVKGIVRICVLKEE